MIIGGVLGGLIGVLAAQLFLRSAERQAGEEGETSLPSLEPGEMIKLTLSVLGVLKLVDRLSKSAK
jgi:F0F1-type ATP synthase assembly protein I